MHWYVPTFYGDFKLTAKGKTHTQLKVTKATETEKKQLAEFQQHALFEHWVEPGVSFMDGTIVLEAPIDKTAEVLAKILKPDRTLITAIKVGDGNIEMLHGTVPAELPEAKATTVAQPVRGCPPTDFDPAEIKARVVLREFLTPQQLADFKRHNKFVAVGADTGTRYMITSRHARDELARYQRSFYDLDRKMPLCAHDWAVPAAEEMLALLICVSLPGQETRLRNLRGH